MGLDSDPSPGPSGLCGHTQTKKDCVLDSQVNEIIDDKQSSDSQVAEKEEYPHGFILFFVILAIIMSIFLASLDMTIVATAIPKITDEFHGLDKVSWYGAAFFMVNGGFQSSWGKAYKYFPLKTTFLASIITLEIGALVGGLAPNSEALIVGRAITGLGASGIGTGAYTIIAFVTEPKRRPMFTGFVGLSYGIACVLGPLVGGAFTDRVSWRWCFYINLPIGGVSALFVFFFFRTPSGAKPVSATWREKFLQMDPVGTMMMMGAIVAYLLALQYAGQTKSWNSSEVIGLLVGVVVILVAFIGWEIFLGERAMVVPRLFAHRTVNMSCLFTFCYSGSYVLILYVLPIYFQSVKNATPIMSGVYNVPLIAGISITMIISGIFISTTGRAYPLLVSGPILATIAAGLLYTFNIDTSTGKWIGYQILGGVGWGLSFQIPIIIGQSGAASEDISSITAMVLFFQNMGSTFLVSAAQCAFVNTLISYISEKVPNIDPLVVVQTGATRIRHEFAPEDVPGVVEAYMVGMKSAFIIPIVLTSIAIFIALGSSRKQLDSVVEKEIVAA